jgi:glycosyltransferase involved in cell wall biosynthesis
MILRKPVVCFASCAWTAETVADTGVVVPELSPVAMAAAIADLVRRPDRMARSGTAARQRALADVRAFTNAYLEAIRAVAAEPARSRF